MKKVLLFGAGFHDNLGDDLILRTVNNEIMDSGMNPTYIIPLTQKLYFSPFDVHRITIPLFESYSNKIKKAYYVAKFLWSNPFNGYDKAIFYGGGYTNQEFGIKNLIDIYLIALKAKTAGAQIYFTGQTVGPSTNWVGEILLKKIYRTANCVFPRERNSKELLDDWKIYNKLTLDDVLLALPDVKNKKEIKDTLVFNFKVYKGYKKYKNQVFSLYKRICSKTNCRIVVIPFRSEEKSEEYKLNFEFYNYIKSDLNSVEFIVPKDYSLLIDIFSRAALVTGLAYHSIVLAKICGARVCTAYFDEYYKAKIHGFLSLFDDTKNCYSMDEFVSLDDSTIEELMTNPQTFENYNESIQKAYLEVKKEWDEVLR